MAQASQAPRVGPTYLTLAHGAPRVNIGGVNYDLGACVPPARPHNPGSCAPPAQCGTQDPGGNKATGAGDYDYYVNFCKGITTLPGASCSCALGDASRTGAFGNDAQCFRNPCSCSGKVRNVVRYFQTLKHTVLAASPMPHLSDSLSVF